jgi:hypothetical protein
MMTKQTTMGGKHVTRRQFLKWAGVSAAAIALNKPVKSFGERRLSLDTRVTIDEFTRSTHMELSDKTQSLLSTNKVYISQYAKEYQAPANLLAAVIASENERFLPKRARDFLFDLAQGFGMAPYINSSEGIAQIKVSLAAWLTYGIYKTKGEHYISEYLPSVAGITDILKKFDKGSDQVFADLSLGERIELGAQMKKALASSGKFSIELAAKYVGYLKEKLKNAHKISDPDFRSNPVALVLLLNGYRGGEAQMNRAPTQEKVSETTITALALLKTGSHINVLFKDEKYRIVSNQRLSISNKPDCEICNSTQYQNIAETVVNSYHDINRGQYVKAALNLRNASQFAETAAMHTNNIGDAREFYKLALFSLAHASKALRDCGVQKIVVIENGKEVSKNVGKVLQEYLSQYRAIYNTSGMPGGSEVILPQYRGTSRIIPSIDEMNKHYVDWAKEHTGTSMRRR